MLRAVGAPLQRRACAALIVFLPFNDVLPNMWAAPQIWAQHQLKDRESARSKCPADGARTRRRL